MIKICFLISFTNSLPEGPNSDWEQLQISQYFKDQHFMSKIQVLITETHL